MPSLLSTSFAGFNARKVVSATAFTVLGVANKMISIFLSLMFVAQAEAAIGYFCLVLCIISSTLFSWFKSAAAALKKQRVRYYRYYNVTVFSEW